MTKIWKVYAQCVTRPSGKAILEITENDLKNEKFNVYDNIKQNADISFLLDKDGEIEPKMEELHDSAIFELIDEEWSKYNLLGCGDYNVICSDEMPSRPNMAGDTTFDTEEIKAKMKELSETLPAYQELNDKLSF